MYLPQTLTPNFLQNERGITYSELGQLGSIGSMGIVLTFLALGNLRPMLGMLVGQLALAVFAIVIWQGNGFGWYAFGYFFIGGYRLARAMIVAFTRPMVAPQQMGAAFGLVELVSALGSILCG